MICLRLATALLLATAASPVLAQSRPTVDQRVDKVEKELKAVQRKVFPAGAQAIIEPEISAPVAGANDFGDSASTPIADLTARVSSMEQEMSRLTGQVEQSQNRLKQLEDQLAKFRGDAEFRINALEGNGGTALSPRPAGAPGTAPVVTPPLVADPAPAPAPAAGPSTGDVAEDAYMAGYRLWEAKKYGEAETALKAYVAKYPQHRRASFAQNLLGRTCSTPTSRRRRRRRSWPTTTRIRAASGPPTASIISASR